MKNITSSSFEKDLLARIKVLMLLRVIIITIFLGSVIVFQQKIGGKLHLSSVVTLTIITYTLTLIYSIILPHIKNLRRFCYIQIVADFFVESGVIYVTGGIESPLSFLFTLSIISTGIIFHRPGIYLMASIASICYGTFIDMEFYNLIRPVYIYPKSDISVQGSYVLYMIFVHISAFFLAAFLTGFLVEKLRVAKKELSEKSDHLQELRAFHENVLKSMGSGLLTMDLYKKITSFNKAAEEITGFRFYEMKGKIYSEYFFHPEIKVIENFGDSLSPYRCEGTLKKKNKKNIFLGMNISPLKNETGSVTGYICVFQDITELKKMEERVTQAERLAAIGKVAAGIAHEIRNPLASMSGSIQVLKQKQWIAKESQDLMDIVIRETERLNTIVTRFLSYARPHPVKLAPHDINILVKDTLSMLINSKEYSSNIVISTEFEQSPLTVRIDSQQVQQVLWNLYLNSIQAMPNGGNLKASTRIINRRNKKLAIVEVTDTGSGINKKDKDKIFEPFYTTKIKGTGLGLASVYRIIENHGGTVSVRSKVSAGTAITIQLPLGT